MSERYELGAEVARGGMGAVLRATDLKICRDVAMKVLHEGDHRRFLNEAKITGQLEHPSIVPVYELGEIKGEPYYTMKLIKGRTLSELLAESATSLPRLLGTFLKACDAIAFAHSRGIIHRDLKPDNIMVGEFGEVLVLDWGLAKPIDADETVAIEQTLNLDAADAQLTLEGDVLGTPAYMSPEQARGDLQNIAETSDIYSLGGILYTILTGLSPVEAKNARQALLRVSRGEIQSPDLRTPQKGIAKELTAITMKAMAHTPEDRYDSVLALSRDIERFLDGRAVSAKSDNAFELLGKLLKRHRGISITAGLALVLVAGVVAVSFLRIRDAMEQAVAGEAAAVSALAEADEARRDKVRSLAEQAVRAAETGFFGDAETFASTAVAVAPEAPFGHWAKGVLAHERGDLKAAMEHFVQAGDFPQAQASAARSAAMLGDLRTAQALLASRDDSHDWRTLFAAGEVMLRLRNYSDAVRALRQAQELRGEEDPRISEALRDAEVWELTAGFHASVAELPPDRQGAALREKMNEVHGARVPFTLSQSPQGMRAQLEGERVKYLHPLAGFPIRELRMLKARAVDLSPLRGTALHTLFVHDCQLSDLSPLTGMPLTHVQLEHCEITDLSPLQGIALQSLVLDSNSELADIAALAGMPLTKLDLGSCPVTDISPLQGMPLQWLDLRFAKISDLSALKGAPLTYLDLRDTLVADLSPLAGAPLETLLLRISQVTDLSPLRGMPLKTLEIPSTRISDLSPIADAPIEVLNLRRSQVRDLTPLARMPLRELYLSERRGLTDQSLSLLEQLSTRCTIVWGD